MAFEIIHESYDESDRMGHLTLWERSSDRSVKVKVHLYAGAKEAEGAKGLKHDIRERAKDVLRDALDSL